MILHECSNNKITELKKKTKSITKSKSSVELNKTIVDQVEELLFVQISGWSEVSERRREGSRAGEEVSAPRRWWE